ncbi:MAG: hypothetical protein QXT68_04575 [Halobacteria archaeon]
MELPWEWAAAVAIPVAALYLLTAAVPASAPDFQERILFCGREPSPARMPCFKWAIADMWARGMNLTGIAAYDRYTREPHVSPGDVGSPFGNNCHTFYHAVGEFIAENLAQEPERAMALAPPTCTGGAYMAILHRLHLVHGYDPEMLRRAYRACPDVPAICAHVVGHALFDKHVSSILEDLDRITASRYGKSPRPYRYAGDTNHSAAFAECREVVEPGNAEQCYTGIAHSFFLATKHRSVDYRDILQECEKTPDFLKECRSNFALRFGFGEVAPILIENNSTGAVAECALLGPDLQADCHRGAGGGLGLWLEAQIVGIEGDRMTPEDASGFIRRHVNLCRSMVPEYVPACIRGMVGTPAFKGLYLRSGLVDPDVEAAIASRPIPIGS